MRPQTPKRRRSRRPQTPTTTKAPSTSGGDRIIGETRRLAVRKPVLARHFCVPPLDVMSNLRPPLDVMSNLRADFLREAVKRLPPRPEGGVTELDNGSK